MMLEYWSGSFKFMDNGVVSVVGSGENVQIFTSDRGPSHHKYLITGKHIKIYELSCDFFRMLPLKAWRVIA